MRIEEVLTQHRNDFSWLGKCEFCDATQKYADGYADQFYCLKVVPSRPCPKCDYSTDEYIRMIEEYGPFIKEDGVVLYVETHS